MAQVHEIQVGDRLPERTFEPTHVSLFLYNAAIWNAHRIHYDELYTTQVEKHPGIVVDGPLQGDWLTQTVLDWLPPEGSLIEFEYSNRRASYLGDRLTSGGTIQHIDGETQEVSLELFIRNEAGQVTTPGRALVRMR